MLFRQQRDASIHRGYLQKSVVVLSRHPFVGMYKRLVRTLAAAYFDAPSLELLESAWGNIAAWPTLAAGQSYDLPIAGEVLRVHVPAPPQTALQWRTNAAAAAGSGGDRTLVAALEAPLLGDGWRRALLPLLFALWELLLVGQPLLVLADSPDICSDAVLLLTALIAPLAYGGEVRPFCTINNSLFGHLSDFEGGGGHPGLIVGASNPFFLKTFGAWPHVLLLGDHARRAGGGKALDGRARYSNSACTKKLAKQAVLFTTYTPLLKTPKTVIKAMLAAKPGSPAAVTGSAKLWKRYEAT